MTNTSDFAAQLQQLTGTQLPPIGIAFVAQAPEGVARLESTGPASCSYWKRAAQGEVFATDLAHHQGCPIGAHTHGVPLSNEKAQELQQMVGTMVQLGYIRMEEVPKIPHRKSPLQSVVYAPLAKLPVAADVVLVRGTARQLMLVAEAAQMAGLADALPTMGRPTCAAVPLAQESGQLAMSLGCVGNRVYTGLADDEAYVAVPGGALEKLVGQLAQVAKANAELEKFHRARV
ncbi:MAG: DUF169 domain-containing protein [Deltaproteobacteria bacterium]|nr:DUF169 domain-containing protein [Deltaproteobacteria bacterium]